MYVTLIFATPGQADWFCVRVRVHTHMHIKCIIYHAKGHPHMQNQWLLMVNIVKANGKCICADDDHELMDLVVFSR